MDDDCIAGTPAVCSGHGGPAAGGDATAAGLVPPAPGVAGDFEGGELAGPGLVGGFDAIAPGDVAAAAAGELAGEEDAACGAGLAPPAGEGLSSSFGARAPMFARSWPMRIFPRNTGRSKM